MITPGFLYGRMSDYPTENDLRNFIKTTAVDPSFVPLPRVSGLKRAN